MTHGRKACLHAEQFFTCLLSAVSSLGAKAGDKVVCVGFSNSYRGTTDDATILRVTGMGGLKATRLIRDANSPVLNLRISDIVKLAPKESE